MNNTILPVSQHSKCGVHWNNYYAISGSSRSERQKNRIAIKSLTCCTHVSAQSHIVHKSNFDKLVDLVVLVVERALKHLKKLL